jgi:riboflavin kinase/FMN adenylyltransferase
VLYIGTRPTFTGKERSIEVHLFETTEDLYGAEMEVSLLHFLRGDQAFPDVESLQRQIQLDVRAARALLRKPLSPG